MAWNSFYSSAGIRSDHFATYDRALAHFNSVKPIRGRTPELRPLGTNRSYTQCEITYNSLTDTVSAVLYGTECVSIDDAGMIRLSTGSWITPSTANFIDAVLPSDFGSVYLKRRRLVYKARDGKEYVIPRDGGLYLHANKDWTKVEVIDTQPAVVETKYDYKADRKVMNAIRKQYSGFLAMLDVMSAMSLDYESGEICEYFPDVATAYIEAQNKHEADQREIDRKIMSGELHKTSVHRWNFNKNWALRQEIENHASLPSLSYLHDMGAGLKVSDLRNGYTLDRYRNTINDKLPRYLQALQDGLSNDIQTVRRLMLSIVPNLSYAHSSGGYGEELTTKVDTLFGEVTIPLLTYTVGTSSIEHFFMDIIKYVYADKIFKKVEVPSGTLPSDSNEKYVLVNEYLSKNSDILTQRQLVV